MPSENHAAVQFKMIVEFSRQPQFRVFSELALELGGVPLT